MADLKRLIEEGLPPHPPNSALPNLQIPGLGKLDLPSLPGFEIKTPASGSGGKTTKDGSHAAATSGGAASSGK